ncbi:uncharacterized protein LACBIDRAFT_301988 [Laccaria bicolor S238N-H82]|uniref:Predicted protein n=1 Tax=Laccaria bicolor (strain S238N-H82 / ATCC MYA-4686) TaxID=486041 RepID=B0CQA7_LACBS|nr:uncharacterized protein LACBIDRAFT_301988 [Laccaria bicolor S238N-H82]EDR15522.1 predicted protein [Laccaria bicolor S238N-H82]|eukprot:XP_001873730.1 predicted protein [Laccaria bicolor S238N-H82]
MVPIEGMSDTSPYAPYLDTNYVPNDPEIDHIKKLLSEPLAQLADLDKEIVRTRATLKNLIGKHGALHNKIKAHRALISPVRRLPPDVLGEIFFHCLPQHRNPAMSAKEAPVLLGRVCSSWRTIVLSTPRLWARIHIPTPNTVFTRPPTPQDHEQLDPGFVDKISHRSKAAEEWIEKSGACPLSISIHMPSYVDTRSRVAGWAFERVTEQLISSRHRWRSLTVRAMDPAFTHLKNIAAEDLPLLESISLVRLHSGWPPHPSSAPPKPWSLCGLLAAPHLRSLSLSFAYENFANLPVKWAQLTKLELDTEGYVHGPIHQGISYQNVKKVLSQCPGLVTCALRLSHPEPLHEMVKFDVRLPRLRNLLLNVSYAAFGHIFNYFELPQLHNIEFKQPFIRTASSLDISLSVPVDILLQNGGTLRSLSLDLYSMRKEDLIICLQSSPGITHLRLSAALAPPFALVDTQSNAELEPVMNDAILTLLTPSSSPDLPSVLCPLLEEFECKGGSQSLHFSDDALVQFLLKRCKYARKGDGTGPLLKRVSVYLDRTQPDDSDVGGLKRIEEVRREGVEVDLKYRKTAIRTPFSPWIGLELTEEEQMNVTGVESHLLPFPF